MLAMVWDRVGQGRFHHSSELPLPHCLCLAACDSQAQPPFDISAPPPHSLAPFKLSLKFRGISLPVDMGGLHASTHYILGCWEVACYLFSIQGWWHYFCTFMSSAPLSHLIISSSPRILSSQLARVASCLEQISYLLLKQLLSLVAPVQFARTSLRVLTQVRYAKLSHLPSILIVESQIPFVCAVAAPIRKLCPAYFPASMPASCIACLTWFKLLEHLACQLQCPQSSDVLLGRSCLLMWIVISPAHMNPKKAQAGCCPQHYIVLI